MKKYINKFFWAILVTLYGDQVRELYNSCYLQTTEEPYARQNFDR
jgi:hypothetical protein